MLIKSLDSSRRLYFKIEKLTFHLDYLWIFNCTAPDASLQQTSCFFKYCTNKDHACTYTKRNLGRFRSPNSFKRRIPKNYKISIRKSRKLKIEVLVFGMFVLKITSIYKKYNKDANLGHPKLFWVKTICFSVDSRYRHELEAVIIRFGYFINGKQYVLYLKKPWKTLIIFKICFFSALL